MIKSLLVIMFTLLSASNSYSKGGHNSTGIGHTMYYLDVGYHHVEGLVENRVKELKLYKEPSVDSQVLYSLPLEDSAWYSLFKDFSFDGINRNDFASDKKKGNFYKTLYKNEEVWINEKELHKVHRVESYYQERSNGIEGLYAGRPLFQKPNGKRIKLPSFSKEFLAKASHPDDKEKLTITVEKSKWIDNRLWIKVKIKRPLCDGPDHYFKGKEEVNLFLW